MNEEQAKKEVESFTGEPDWFCPLINAQCNSKCCCFAPPFARKDSYSDEWYVNKAFCDNAMFTQITIQY